jgi:Ca2+-transporting ATPase
MFLTAVSLAVAAIPEGLPAVVTIALALGVQRMVRRHALIRKLPSVETLGCATVICSDKTGTLTKNEMTVQAIFAGGSLFKITGIGYAPSGKFLRSEEEIDASQYPDLIKVLTLGVLCNAATLTKNDDGYKIIGDPTEGALLTCAGKADILKEGKEKEFNFFDEIPFDSERKKMTVIRSLANGKIFAFVKGAPDILLNNCTAIEENSNTRALSEEDKETILRVNNDLANCAMRVLAVAYREVAASEKIEADAIEANLIFAGLFAMIDPPREEVRRAMEECKTAGIKTVMITGDHKNTAVAIAKDLGFFEKGSLALTGEELDRLSEDEFRNEIEKIPVYARVSPENKLRIVRAWRARGEVVAMTGDGVNDAPAYRRSDGYYRN